MQILRPGGARGLGLNLFPALPRRGFSASGAKGFFAIVAVVGLGGMVGQLLLIRELLIAFYGNELTMGVVLANWLLLEALGALVAGRRSIRALGRPSFFLRLPAFFICPCSPCGSFFQQGGEDYFF